MELILLIKALHSAAIGSLGLFGPQGREMREAPASVLRTTKDEMTLPFRAELYGSCAN